MCSWIHDSRQAPAALKDHEPSQMCGCWEEPRSMSGTASVEGEPVLCKCWRLQDPEALLKRVLALQPGWTIVQPALLLSSKLPAGSRVLSDVFGDPEAPHEQQVSHFTA